MPIRETVTKTYINFTDTEWEELVNLYQHLDSLMDEGQYPQVSEEDLQSLITNMQRALVLIAK